MHILVVEDEHKIADALRKGLEAEGYQVTIAASGEDGYFCMTTGEYELMLLDIMLPGRDGIEILHAIRRKGITTPILVGIRSRIVSTALTSVPMIIWLNHLLFPNCSPASAFYCDAGNRT